MFLLLLVVIAIGAFLISIYNALRTRSESVKRANSDMIGMMRKRVTLVNQLVDICKGYGEHEKLTHITIAENVSSLAESALAARSVNAVIDRVTALAASFPELRANGTYEKLMDQLSAVENDIQTRREQYNRAVEAYNTKRASFPAVLFSDALGFPEAPYFRTTEDGLEVPVEFRTDDGALLRDTMKRIGDSAATRSKELARKAGAQIDQFREQRAQAGHDTAASTADRPETPPDGQG